MKVIKPYTEILDVVDGKEVLRKIERAARTCYKSEGRITEGSAEKLVAALVKNGHEAMLEHASMSIKFVVDRGVSHELVRHRIASYAQESTRYCNYSKEKFDTNVTFIKPCYLVEGSDGYAIWESAMCDAEGAYFDLLMFGCLPQEARAVLPNSLKTEIVMTANMREWRNFFKLRAGGAFGRPHPQMLEVTVPLLAELKKLVPIIFDDIEAVV